MTTPDRDHQAGDPELNAHGQLRLHHLRVGLPPGPLGWDRPVAEAATCATSDAPTRSTSTRPR